jgi:hypothetical protein
LVFDGDIDDQMGILLIRIYGTTVAAITQTGLQLELFYIGAPQNKSGSHVKIPLSRAATSLHLDDEYPKHWFHLSATFYEIVCSLTCFVPFFGLCTVLILGHIDGSISIFDRVKGTLLECVRQNTARSESAEGADATQSGVGQEAILWLERSGEYVFAASHRLLQVRLLSNPQKVEKYSLPDASRLEQAHIHSPSQTCDTFRQQRVNIMINLTHSRLC